MEVVVRPDAGELGSIAADAIERVVRERRDAVLGMATGSSPLPIYQELVRRHRAGNAPSYEKVTTFNLDEYVGLPAGHPQSYRETIRRELTDHLDVPMANVHGPDPSPSALREAGDRYERAIRAAGGIDLQVLGIGSDGHLAFNEPGSSLASRTRLKTLTHRTRQDNARFFGSFDAVPVHVLTQGIGTILEARHLVLIATGATKARAVARAVEGPVTAMCPGSALQLHPHVTLLLDPDAASELGRLDYYREVFAAKPPWQHI